MSKRLPIVWWIKLLSLQLKRSGLGLKHEPGPWLATARAIIENRYQRHLSFFFHFGNPFIKDRSRKLWKGRKGPRLNPPRSEIREMLMMRRRNNGILMSRPSLLCRAARACIFIRCNSLNGFSLVRTQARDFYEQTWSKKRCRGRILISLLIDNQASGSITHC